MRRFGAQAKNVRTKMCVDMQIAYKQLEQRLVALKMLFKTLKRFNSSQNFAAFDESAAPAKLLEKFLKATHGYLVDKGWVN